MTNLLYTTDAYLQEFTAHIMALDTIQHAVILDQTAFYPGGGGQIPDIGTLTVDSVDYAVKRAKKQSGVIIHIIEGDALPAEGIAIHGKINWERRYQAMRTHTAMHILCGVIWRDHQVSVTGGNMDLLEGRMDFEFDELTRDMIAEIETVINQEVQNGRAVQANILPRAEAFQIPDLIRTKINLLPEGIHEVRTVEIVGLDLQADGGTHVNNTAEVGAIRITDYKSKGKGNKRLYIKIED